MKHDRVCCACLAGMLLVICGSHPLMAQAPATQPGAAAAPASQPTSRPDDAPPAASMITLHETDIAPQALFAKVFQQCDAALPSATGDTWSQAPARVSIDIDNMPFWAAMDELADRTGVRLDPNGTVTRLVRGNPSEPRSVHVIDGPMRVRVTQTQLTRSVRFANDVPLSERFTVPMQAMLEPKFDVLSVMSQPRIDEAVDDKGNSLLPPDPGTQVPLATAQATKVWGAAAKLKYPENPGRRIASLKGSFTVVVLGKSQRVEINDITNANGGIKKAGPLRVAARDFQKEGDNYSVHVQLDGVSGADPRLLQGSFAVLNAAKLLDEQGETFPRAGSSGGGGGLSYGMTLKFRGEGGMTGKVLGAPATLVLDVPVEVRQMSLPFEFTDLPMP